MKKYKQCNNKNSKNNTSEISGPTWIEKFKSPDRLCSTPTIQGYFEYIIKKHETFANIL